MKRVLIVLAVLVALPPLGLLAQLPVATDACMQAQMDAQADVNGTLWFFAGCLLGIWGVGAAYVIEPSPPASRLVGQPPDYVAMYTDCYKDKAKSIQTSASMKGCVIGYTLSAVGYLFWILLYSAAATTYYY